MVNFFRQALVVFGLICLLQVLCLGQIAEAGTTGKKTHRWKIATLAPKDFGFSKLAQTAIYPQLEAACDDAIKLKLYWGGVMGDDNDYLRKMRIGQLQGAALSSAGTIIACPEFAVVELPFLFNNYEEVDYIRERMFSTFNYLFAQYGYKLGLWLDQDFDPLFSVEVPIATLEDFKKARFGTAHGPMEEIMFQTLGADIVPMTVPEAPTAFRTGVVNAGLAPTVFILGSQMYRVAKYITPLKIRYSPAATIISLDSWNQLEESCKETLEREQEAGAQRMNALIRDFNTKFLKALYQYGLTEVKVTPENKALIKQRALSIYEELAGDVYPPELLMEINQYLDEVRSGEISALPVRKPVETKKVAVKPEKRPVVPVAAPVSAPVVKKRQIEKKVTPKKKRNWWAERKQRIKEVQKRLKPLGLYPSRIDGLFGPMTKRGIIKFQKLNGLPVTGEVDGPLLKFMGIK